MKASANPFRSSSVEQIRYALPSEALAALVDHALGEPCSCLLGPKGTGKTTLLEDLESHMQRRDHNTHWTRLKQESTQQDRADAIAQLQQLDAQHVCLFDGAEVLNFWQWRRVCKLSRTNGFALIATLHRKRGVPILLRTQPDWPLVEQFVQQLSATYFSETLREHAQQAFQASNGNMREVFRACYLALAKENPKES
jgi:hypothetical protein